MPLLSSSRKTILFLVLALPVFGESSVPGIKNFHQVDQNVYRGAQPTVDGFKYLANIGVKTVLNLREADQRSKAEETIVTSVGMKYINVPMTGVEAPTDAQITRVLGLLEGNGGAVFVHCKRGADRTGVVIASYRIDHDGWDNAHALSEAKSRGMAFFQFPRMNYIRTFHPRALQAASEQVTGSQDISR